MDPRFEHNMNSVYHRSLSKVTFPSRKSPRRSELEEMVDLQVHGLEAAKNRA